MGGGGSSLLAGWWGLLDVFVVNFLLFIVTRLCRAEGVTGGRSIQIFDILHKSTDAHSKTMVQGKVLLVSIIS